MRRARVGLRVARADIAETLSRRFPPPVEIDEGLALENLFVVQPVFVFPGLVFSGRMRR